MVFFDKEAQALRARWKTIDVKAVNFADSPFGLTEDGLQDFRGYTGRGTLGDEYIMSKKRFEKCDLSFSQFVHCKIVDSWFVSSKLYAVDFHSCQVISCPMPNCMTELLVRYQKPESPKMSFETHLRFLLSGIGAERPTVRTREKLEISDLDRAIVLCLSIQSLPSSESFLVLAKLLGSADHSPPLVALNRDDFRRSNKRDMQQMKILFGDIPSGLGEVAWVKNQKVLASDSLTYLPMRKTIVERLGQLGCRAHEQLDELSEERFWEIVDLANPYERDERAYSPQAHADRLIEVLKALPDRDLRLFENFRDSLCAQIYTFEMATAASIIGTGCGDDSFGEFCHALVYRGREVFYNVLNNTEEALLNLDGAHYLLLEGFTYLTEIADKQRSKSDDALLPARPSCLWPSVGFGGQPIDDDEKAFRKRFPRLFKKYWDKEEYQLNYALSLDYDSGES